MKRYLQWSQWKPRRIAKVRNWSSLEERRSDKALAHDQRSDSHWWHQSASHTSGRENTSLILVDHGCYRNVICLDKICMWYCCNSYCSPCVWSQASSSCFSRTVPGAHSAWGNQLSYQKLRQLSTDLKEFFQSKLSNKFVTICSKIIVKDPTIPKARCLFATLPCDVSLITVHVSGCCCFSDIDILLGCVATRY